MTVAIGFDSVLQLISRISKDLQILLSCFTVRANVDFFGIPLASFGLVWVTVLPLN